MARPKGAKNKAKPTHATEAVKRPQAADVQQAVAAVNREKESAAEYTGLAGQATKTFCDRWNISKQAFGFVRKLAGMDAQKRQAVLIDTADLCKAMGYTDQSDFFVNVAAAVDGLKGEAPTDEEIAERTDADLAETPSFVAKDHAERINGEIDATLNGGLPN